MAEKMAQARFDRAIAEISKTAKVWILTDSHGAVMLNSDEESCVPVWPNEEEANAWANEDWAGCITKAIPFAEWRKNWTSGLMRDDLCVVVNPTENLDGIVLYPDEFEFEITRRA